MILPLIFAATVLVSDAEGQPLDSAECRAAHVERVGSNEWRWHPADGTEALMCSARGFEPFDLGQTEAGSKTESYTVVLGKARAVTVKSAAGVGSVEWRKPTEDGLILLAKRALRDDHDVVIDVAGDMRILSFVWEDGRRTSICVPPEATALHIERPDKGGEFATWLGTRHVRPAQIRLRLGELTKTAAVDQCGFASVTGLDQGLYSGEAVYKSGIAVRFPPVKITDGMCQLPATLVPPAGAVFVEVTPEYCADLSEESQVAVSAAPIKDEKHPVGSVALDDRACTAVLDGLGPGEYLISAMRKDGQGASPAGHVVVRADHMEELPIKIDLPRVDGIVVLGDRPAGGVLVHFQAGGYQESASTDRAGRFSVILEKPGHYRVDVRTAPYIPGDLKEVEVRNGRQELRLALPPGRIVVIARASSGELDEGVEISLRRGDSTRTGIALADEFRAEFIGLPPGKYSITATGRSGSGWITPHPTEIEIESDDPDRELEVYLEKRESRMLTVQNEGGQPIPHTHVQVGSLLVQEVAPGTFEIPADAAYRMYIRADDYLPVCRDLGEWEERITVTLRHGTFAATIRLGADARNALRSSMGVQAFGSVLGLPESTCAVSAFSLPHEISDSGETTVLRITGLPAGRYTYVDLTGRAVPMDVPGEAITVP